MKKLKLLSMYLIISILSFGCSDIQATDVLPMAEVSEYTEERVQLEGTPEVYISCENANIEIYTWDSREAKFEIKKRARGREEKETLREKLKDFDIAISKSDNKLFFKSAYKHKVKFPSERIIDLVLYLPKRISLLEYDIQRGSFKIYDDVNCTLRAEFSNGNLDVNRFSGCLNIRGDAGNVTISGGKLNGISSISLGEGNISIKAQFDNSGAYSFVTGIGNVELSLPKNSKLSVLCSGRVTMNEFQSTIYPAVIMVKNKMGRISVVGY